MEQRNVFITALIVLAVAVVAIAVLAAGFIILSVLGDHNPGPSPIAHGTPTPYPQVTLPFGPSATNGPVATPNPTQGSGPVPTPVPQEIKSAQLVGHGTDKDTYMAGETATAYITVRNTGNVAVNNATLHISVARQVPAFGYVNLGSRDTALTNMGVQPGETKQVSYDITIPSSYEGVSTAGNYEITVDVYIWGTNIGTFTQYVKVQ